MFAIEGNGIIFTNLYLSEWEQNGFFRHTLTHAISVHLTNHVWPKQKLMTKPYMYSFLRHKTAYTRTKLICTIVYSVQGWNTQTPCFVVVYRYFLWTTSDCYYCYYFTIVSCHNIIYIIHATFMYIQLLLYDVYGNYVYIVGLFQTLSVSKLPELVLKTIDWVDIVMLTAYVTSYTYILI